jgi:hypothetical protein
MTSASSYVIVHVESDRLSFWTGYEWTVNRDSAKHYTYTEAAGVIWKDLPSPVGTYTTVPFEELLELK